MLNISRLQTRGADCVQTHPRRSGRKLAAASALVAMLGTSPAWAQGASVQTIPFNPTPPPAASAYLGMVPVRFEGPAGEYLAVDVVGAHAGRCQLPCALYMVPGTNTIQISGAFEMQGNLEVPAQPAVVTVRRASRGRRAAGWTIFGLGAITSLALQVTQKDVEDTTLSEARGRLVLAVGALGLVLVGGILALTAGNDALDVSLDGRALGPATFRGVALLPTKDGAVAGASWIF